MSKKTTKKKTTKKTVVTEGCEVAIHYRGTLEDGTEFDSSYTKEKPITATVGSGMLIAGFETALMGMNEGETKSFTLAPDEAYGERDETHKVDLGRDQFPEDFTFEAGRIVPLQGPSGETYLASIVEYNDNDETVTFDMNHPMAGKTLNFDIEVVSINDAQQ